MGKGTSATPTGLSPEVEPLTGLDGSATSIPSAVTLVTQREMIRGVPEAWRAAYADGYWAGDTWKQDILRQLDALDTETCTPTDIALVIGNSSWTENECDVCHADCETIARLGDEPSLDARWQDICLPCLAALGSWAAQAMSAARQRGPKDAPQGGQP